jgi:hypothetical protein
MTDSTRSGSTENTLCSVCGKQAPTTETHYTLLSSAYGWRKALQRAADGSRLEVWTCKECWEGKHKPS